MVKEEIVSKLKELTKHQFIELTTRGNSALKTAVSLVNGTVLIPEEGGWLEYQKVKNHVEVKCDQAKIDLDNLKNKLETIKPATFLYQNPGGYFAEQPIKEIYDLCKKNDCLVILDVSGSIGTELCDGNYADIIVGSFGRWKPVNAEAGGFISFKDEELYQKAKPFIEKFEDESSLKTIKEKLDHLDNRINFLQDKIKKIKEDLKNFNLVRSSDKALVVVVKFSGDEEKQKVIKYCQNNNLEYTECPRYIRLNQKAISIEVKRL